MTEQLYADYLDRYEGIQAQIHQISQFDDTSVLSTTYFDRIERSRRDILMLKSNFNHRSVYNSGYLIDGTYHKLFLSSGATKCLCQTILS